MEQKKQCKGCGYFQICMLFGRSEDDDACCGYNEPPQPKQARNIN